MKFNPSQTKKAFNLTDAHLLWCLGDWTALDNHSEKIDVIAQPEIALYIAAAQCQLGKSEQAKKLLASLGLDNEKKQIAVKLLISGVYNSLGKAHTCAFNHKSAKLLFNHTLHCALPQPISQSLINARTIEQHAQIGIPHLADHIKACEFKPDLENFFLKSEKHFKNEPAYQLALAELYQLNEHYDKAIMHWQNVSGLLNTDTPQLFYDRLKDAYKSVKGFPQGTLEQETRRGDIDKHRLLSEIHKYLQPEFYFEIGVQAGKSLALAKCEAIGIDPMPILTVELPPTATVVTSSSDSFFGKQSNLSLPKSIDFSFIDGMHLFEYALRDFISVEKYAHPHALIVIDDIFPCHPDQAKRERCTRTWTGDVWKLKETLEKYRPDLFILAIDAYPTGMLLISALDANNTTLSDSYQTILDNYSTDMPVPDRITRREGAISGSSEIICNIVTALKLARQNQTESRNIKSTLNQLILQ